MMKVVDYLDHDVAYLLGLIVGRGEMAIREENFYLVLPFRFVSPDLAGLDQFSGFVAGVAGQVMVRLQRLLGLHVGFDISDSQQEVRLTIRLPRDHLVVRNILLILAGNPHASPPHYSDLEVPRLIQEADADLKKEFLRGFADISGNIRPSNRDRTGFHRVYLDVLNSNWKLPVQICALLQDSLEIPVANILWGHPNLRDPQASDKHGGLREHQIRIYAHRFLPLGFYIDHKQQALKRLAEENHRLMEERRSRDPARRCPGYSARRSTKDPHPMEKSDRLPEPVRRHFDAYWEICAAMGCPYAQRALTQPSFPGGEDVEED